MKHLTFELSRSARLLAITSALAFGLAACAGDDSTPATPTFTATLTGAQEVPVTVTTATGTGSLSLNTSTREISGSITTTGMTVTAAHIHIGAAGVNGPVVVVLIPTSDANTWIVPPGDTDNIANNDNLLSESEVTALLANGLYFNAHNSTNFPAGQIRGQIVGQ